MPKTCSVESCESGHRVVNSGGSNFCNRHYLQMRRHGKTYTTRNERRAVAAVDADTAMIPLGVGAKDGYTIIDAQYAYLAKDNWRKTHWGYVIRSKDRVLLHRIIMNPEQGKVVDHINGDPLDNRVKNLRVCTQSQNAKNQKTRRNNTTGVRGVYKDRSGKFVARIKSDYKQIRLGTFASLSEARNAYARAAKKYHKDFARIA